eukprot:748885-Hanusia_phi.AAC.1
MWSKRKKESKPGGSEVRELHATCSDVEGVLATSSHADVKGTRLSYKCQGLARQGAQEPFVLDAAHCPQAPSAAEFAHFRDLLQAKCDEVDDLHNNLRLAKDSLRQLSEELDQKNTRCESLEEQSTKLKAENDQLNAEIEELRKQVRQRDEVTDLLEGEISSFRESLQVLA